MEKWKLDGLKHWEMVRETRASCLGKGTALYRCVRRGRRRRLLPRRLDTAIRIRIPSATGAGGGPLDRRRDLRFTLF